MRIVIEVSGGMVQEVYCDDPNVAVVLVDWDTESCSGDDQGIVTVRDNDDQEHLVHAVEFPTTPTNQMPHETHAAVESANCEPTNEYGS